MACWNWKVLQWAVMAKQKLAGNGATEPVQPHSLPVVHNGKEIKGEEGAMEVLWYYLDLHCIVCIASIVCMSVSMCMDKPSKLCSPRRGLNVLPLLPPTNG